MTNYNKRGRPSLELTPELSKTLIVITTRYRQEVKPRGILTSNGLFKYAKELYDNKEINFNLGEHFWKNGHGRKAIEDINAVILTTVVQDSQSNFDIIVDTIDAVDKFYNGNSSDKKKLINSLKRNEDNLLRKHKELNSAKKKLNEYEEKLERIEEKNKVLSENIKTLESLFFSWLDASSDGDNNLIDLIHTGKSRHNIVTELFLKGFSNPKEGFDKFEAYTQNKIAKPNNVIEIAEKKIKKSVSDDLNW